jgi:hypothetical protein
MIALSEDLDAKLRSRAAEAGYADPREYVRVLIAADADDSQEVDPQAPPHLRFGNKTELEKMLVEGLDSGPAKEITPAQWAEHRRKLQERHARPASR